MSLYPDDFAIVKARREGFVDGAKMTFDKIGRGASKGQVGPSILYVEGRDIRELAAEKYPLPKIIQPRVVRDVEDPKLRFRFLDGHLQYEWSDTNVGSGWSDDVIPRFCHAAPDILARRFALWSELIANPKEEIEL